MVRDSIQKMIQMGDTFGNDRPGQDQGHAMRISGFNRPAVQIKAADDQFVSVKYGQSLIVEIAPDPGQTPDPGAQLPGPTQGQQAGQSGHVGHRRRPVCWPLLVQPPRCLRQLPPTERQAQRLRQQSGFPIVLCRADDQCCTTRLCGNLLQVPDRLRRRSMGCRVQQAVKIADRQ